MWVPSVESIVEVLRLGEPPTVWQALVYAIGLHILSIPLNEYWVRLSYRYGLLESSLTPLGRWLRRLASPSLFVHRLFPNATSDPRCVRHLTALDDLGGHWDVYGFIATDATAEELLFRGLPMAVALWLGYSPIIPVVCGTLLWVALHDRSAIAPTFMSGVLYTWLWLSGAWSIAISFHIAGNGLAHTYFRWRNWSKFGRYPDPMPD